MSTKVPSVQPTMARSAISPTVKGMVASWVSPPAEVMTVVNEPAPVVPEPVTVKEQPFPESLRAIEAMVEETLVASAQLVMS